MLRHGNALGRKVVECTDNLQLEGGADPHCVGIGQFLDDVGARLLTPTDGLYGGKPGITG